MMGARAEYYAWKEGSDILQEELEWASGAAIF